MRSSVDATPQDNIGFELPFEIKVWMKGFPTLRIMILEMAPNNALNL